MFWKQSEKKYIFLREFGPTSQSPYMWNKKYLINREMRQELTDYRPGPVLNFNLRSMFELNTDDGVIRTINISYIEINLVVYTMLEYNLQVAPMKLYNQFLHILNETIGEITNNFFDLFFRFTPNLVLIAMAIFQIVKRSKDFRFTPDFTVVMILCHRQYGILVCFLVTLSGFAQFITELN